MVFNWFRRQFISDETPEQDAVPVEQEQEAPVVSEAAEPETEPLAAAPAVETVPEPSIVAAAAAEPEAAPLVEIPVVETIPEPPIVSAAVVETETEPLVETPAVETISEPPIVQEEVAEPEAAPLVATATAPAQPTPISTPEPVVASAPAVSEDTLAWAKAAYENLKKQQAATAVAPVSETPPETAEIEAEEDGRPAWQKETVQERLASLREQSIEAPVEEEIEIDEDFLWSARVLAEQGRSPEEVALAEIAWLKKLRQGLNKTRLGLVNQVKALIGQGPLSAEAETAIETLLLQADVGIEATDYILGLLQTKLRAETLPPEEAIAYLKQILRDLLDKPFQKDYSTDFVPQKDILNIWLLTGVNGVGKTTTIGKLAHMSKESGYRCLIAAADTFRAAAVEQVKVWGARSGIEVIANPGQNTDPGSVVFDAIAAAKARNTELLLVDTAGRLQNKKNLMDELGKIRRIIDKQAAGAQIESLLVLDATLGQNGLRQAQVFAEAAKLSGVVLTKLDGTARGGVALAVVQQLGLPIRFIGAGEGIEDLRPFSSYEFVEALLSS
jgi:fused signal recognition particle receptor